MRLLSGLMMNPGSPVRALEIKSRYFNVLYVDQSLRSSTRTSKVTDQHDADEPHAGAAACHSRSRRNRPLQPPSRMIIRTMMSIVPSVAGLVVWPGHMGNGCSET